MPLSQRRRPPPLGLVPRQIPTPSQGVDLETGEPESPDTPGTTPGPDTPDIPSPPGVDGAEGFSTDDEGEDEEEEEEEDGTLDGSASASVPTATTESAPGRVTAVIPPGPSASSDTISSESTQTTSPPQAVPQVSIVSSETETPVPTLTVPVFDETSQQVPSTVIPSAPNTGLPNVEPGRPQISPSEPQNSTDSGSSAGLGTGAEAALITFAIIGAIALGVGAYFFFRRRRAARARKPTTDFEGHKSKGGGPNFPDTAREPHMTRSTNSASLFGPAHYQRPETVSTDKSQTRMQPPQPTPNPFADPPLSKAYDVLRGRPRSTTLTNRESWDNNPFVDPVSERFDPFGELQAKAREERAKYLEELRLEQEYLQKEREDLAK